MPFLPTDLAGLVGWWRADAISGLQDGDPVSTWPDSSGNSRHVTQATAASKPTYRTSVLNGKPAVRYDGVDDSLQTTAMPDFGDAYTVFCVARLGTTELTQAIVGDLTSAAGVWAFAFFHDNGNSIWRTTGAAGNHDRLFSDPPGTFKIFTGILDQTTSTAFRDGVQKNTGPYTAPNPNVITTLRLGQLRASASYVLDGDQTEVILYSRALSATERQQVETYLGEKYAISVPDPYVVSVAPPFSPRDLSGLEGWWKADAITGLIDGDPISSWVDTSGNGRALAQGTAASKPTYRTNVLNGNPIVRFDGVDDFLTGAMPVIAQPMTWFYVARPSGAPLSKQGIVGALGGTTNLIEYGQLIANYDLYAGIEVGFTTPAPSLGVFTAFMWLQNGTSSAFAVNGAIPTTVNTGTNLFGSGAAGIVVGARNNAGTEPLNGDIAEIIFYSRALSTAEQQQVNAYATCKYLGIGCAPPKTLPVAHTSINTRGLRKAIYAD